MKCPHCLVEFHDEDELTYLRTDSDEHWFLNKRQCANPACMKFIIELINSEQIGRNSESGDWEPQTLKRRLIVYPKTTSRRPVPIEVPRHIAEDYTEACLVLADSLKASAALSRRCLQIILREKGGVKKGDLANEIQEALDKGILPSHLADSIDAIRNIGNFAAHPLKSSASGEIINVETGEAEWNLDVLEALFDFFYVQPESIKRKRESLNQKLKDLGKPEMK